MTVLPFRRRPPGPAQTSRRGRSRSGLRLLGDAALAAGILFIVWAVAYGLQRPPTAPLTGRATVHDGDTVTVAGERMRLKGIDAPELAQRCEDADGAVWSCGRAARDRLTALASGRVIECAGRGRDRYHRLLVHCTTGGQDINGMLVAEGWALAYGDYEAEERAAKSAGRGLWAGRFERPQEWRADRGDMLDLPHDMMATIRGLLAEFWPW